MSRDLKNKRCININIDRNVYAILDAHCDASGQTKTVAIERAIRVCYGPNRLVSNEDIINAQFNDMERNDINA